MKRIELARGTVTVVAETLFQTEDAMDHAISQIACLPKPFHQQGRRRALPLRAARPSMSDWQKPWSPNHRLAPRL